MSWDITHKSLFGGSRSCETRAILFCRCMIAFEMCEAINRVCLNTKLFALAINETQLVGVIITKFSLQCLVLFGNVTILNEICHATFATSSLIKFRRKKKHFSDSSQQK